MNERHNQDTPKLTGISQLVMILSELQHLSQHISKLKMKFRGFLFEELLSRNICGGNFHVQKCMRELETTILQIVNMIRYTRWWWQWMKREELFVGHITLILVWWHSTQYGMYMLVCFTYYHKVGVVPPLCLYMSSPCGLLVTNNKVCTG